MIVGQTFSRFARDYIFDMTMNTFAMQAELEKCRLVEQTLQIDIRVLADQIDVN
ncbi:hypothetical protein D3C78_1991150 [compost metagenome]